MDSLTKDTRHEITNFEASEQTLKLLAAPESSQYVKWKTVKCSNKGHNYAIGRFKNDAPGDIVKVTALMSETISDVMSRLLCTDTASFVRKISSCSKYFANGSVLSIIKERDLGGYNNFCSMKHACFNFGKLWRPLDFVFYDLFKLTHGRWNKTDASLNIISATNVAPVNGYRRALLLEGSGVILKPNTLQPEFTELVIVLRIDLGNSSDLGIFQRMLGKQKVLLKLAAVFAELATCPNMNDDLSIRESNFNDAAMCEHSHSDKLACPTKFQHNKQAERPRSPKPEHVCDEGPLGPNMEQPPSEQDFCNREEAPNTIILDRSLETGQEPQMISGGKTTSKIPGTLEKTINDYIQNQEASEESTAEILSICNNLCGKIHHQILVSNPEDEKSASRTFNSDGKGVDPASLENPTRYIHGNNTEALCQLVATNGFAEKHIVYSAFECRRNTLIHEQKVSSVKDAEVELSTSTINDRLITKHKPTDDSVDSDEDEMDIRNRLYSSYNHIFGKNLVS